MGVYALWALVVGFLAGVFLRSIAPLGLSFVGFLLLSAVAIFLLSLANRKSAHGIVTAAVLLALGAGILRMDAAVLLPDSALAERLGEEVTLEGFVFNEPDVREASARLAVKLEGGTRVVMIAPAHADVSYGDRIRAAGTLRLPEAFETRVGREFDYPAYLAKDGISYELAFVRDVEVVGRGPINPVKSFAIGTKHLFLEGLGRVLSEPHAGLAGGITVGDKRGLGAELSNVFRTVGLIHIVVLSGYNIMIVMEGLSRLLQWFSASRYVRLGMTIFVAIFFALMTGMAAASVRAAAMAVIAVVGRISGRMYLASRALALTAAGMVMWNPYILVFDPSFQLSVLATVGLIAFTPMIITKLRFMPTKFGLREIAATTLGAQITVLPLLLYQGGQLSLFALPANLLALVAVPWAMLFSAVAALGGLLLEPLGAAAAFPAYALLAYMIGIANLLASLPYASLALPAFSAWWLVLVYVLLLILVFVYSKRTSTPAPVHS